MYLKAYLKRLDLVQKVHRLNLLSVHYLGIYLRGYDVLMSQQFAGGIEVHSHREQGGGKGMTSFVHNLSKSNGK
jgi:hypothetical protein